MKTITKEYLQEDARLQAEFCRIFSNSRRVMILWALSKRELSVGEIAEVVGSSLPNVSQHLSLMKDVQLVASRRCGQTIYYRIDLERLKECCSGLLNSCKAQEEENLLIPNVSDEKGKKDDHR